MSSNNKSRSAGVLSERTGYVRLADILAPGGRCRSAGALGGKACERDAIPRQLNSVRGSRRGGWRISASSSSRVRPNI
jgi:hypothetical protein